MDAPPWNAALPIVGIDLGTTFSRVAYVDAGGTPHCVANSRGQFSTPSAVLCTPDGISIGSEAQERAIAHPAGLAECFKRDMGRDWFRRPLDGQQVPPEVLSGFLLEQLRCDAQKALGPIRQAVITVPAYFDELRRRATQEAGRLAGWEVLDIINEPTAAALAYGWQLQRGTARSPGGTRRILVYDLGGGTFDVSLLEIAGLTFRTVATDGDVHLGGKDFDGRLVDYAAAEFAANCRFDPRENLGDAVRFWREAEAVKRQLTEHAHVQWQCLYGNHSIVLDISRQRFEEITEDLLERTHDTTDLVVRQAGFAWPQIDEVILAGGSSRMPMVANMLRQLSGREPRWVEALDEAVARGAAIYAASLAGPPAASSPQPRCELINVNSHSLGVVGVDQRTTQRVNAVVIPRNTPIPARSMRIFHTLYENQPSIEVPVVEGESERPEFCVALGRCVISNLPPGLPKGANIEVDYGYSANGRLAVSARVPSVDRTVSVEIVRGVRPLECLRAWRGRLANMGPAEHYHDIPPRGEVTEVPAPPSTQAPDAAPISSPLPPNLPADRAELIRRLDALFIRVGEAALQTSTPPAVAVAAAAAAHARQELDAHRQRLVEAASLPGGSSFEAAATAAYTAQLRRAEQQAARVADFTCLVLGRECVRAAFVPPSSGVTLDSIQHLQRLLLVASAPVP